MNPDQVVDVLGAVFVKYNAPMGLMNKLMCLQQFDGLEFIMDDSGSMSTANEQGVTRWKEAQERLKELFDFLAFVPIPPIKIRFLNRHKVSRLVCPLFRFLF